MTTRSEMIQIVADSAGLPVSQVTICARKIGAASPWTSEKAADLLLALVAAPTPAAARARTHEVAAFQWCDSVGTFADGKPLHLGTDTAIFPCFASTLGNQIGEMLDALRRGEDHLFRVKIERLAVFVPLEGGTVAALEVSTEDDGELLVSICYSPDGAPIEDLGERDDEQTRSIPGSAFYAAAMVLGPLGRRLALSDQSIPTSPTTTIH